MGNATVQEVADEDDDAETIQDDDHLYAVLGVSRDASAQSIRSAYHARAKAFHPDLNPGDSLREAAFLRVTNAYQILRDPHLRERYDLGEIGPDGEELSPDYYDPEASAYREANAPRATWPKKKASSIWPYAAVGVGIVFAAATLIVGLQFMSPPQPLRNEQVASRTEREHPKDFSRLKTQPLPQKDFE